MKINCIIVDDESIARKVVQEFVEEWDWLQLVGQAESPLKAINLLAQHSVDLLFLDIEMPQMSGLELLKNLPNPPAVIVTTAYPQYALEGFELNVLNYLLKPISMERFLKAALKAKAFFEQKNKTAAPNADYFFVKCDGNIERIELRELLYVKALENYIIIQTAQRKYITYLTMKGLEDYLPTEQFVKIHKSYLVPIAKIDRIEGNEVHIGNEKLPLSRNLRAEVLERIEGKLVKR
ncbi:LytTR family DNA-binding domain-containing protein [Runella sp.]|jgi:DNA-binding LytR/AlgR family response regulator|uniref:LytR/AlgR family response regulator transcription factor n=2 Tax=Runella sp. TaxID=1960881 RepID=UPI00301A0C1F